MAISDIAQIQILKEDIVSLIETFKKIGKDKRTSPVKRAPSFYPRFCDILVRSAKICPNNITFFDVTLKSSMNFNSAIYSLNYSLQLIEREKKFKLNINEKKLFLGAEDKLKMAGKSYENEDYPSTFNNLNTVLELVLKDTRDIPLTITKINTSDVINILVKHKLGPVQHLKEVQKHVLAVDNKIKHQAYNPSKIDSINAIKSMEDLLPQLKKEPINLTEEIKNKIFNQI
ncbi:MAG TPA: hypothetical protein VMY59_10475 [Candidatus Thermoplasmatota archaeon]|nr:hypothetical protein [Candidatus Thermoplasmatota archaeon]